MTTDTNKLKWWNKYTSPVIKQWKRFNPFNPDNRNRFYSFINEKCLIIKPFALDGLGVYTILVIILCSCCIISRYHILEIITSVLFSVIVAKILLLLAVAACLVVIIVKWERIKSFIKDNFIILALLLLYIFFFPFWESLIGKQIIDPFFRNCKPCLLSDVIFFLILIACSSLCYFNRNKRIKQSTYLQCIIVLAFWCYYRFSGNLFGNETYSYYLDFKPFCFTKQLYYVDILPILAICTLIAPILGKLQKCINSSEQQTNRNLAHGFERDVPIDINKDDYNRHFHAEEATNQLLNTDTSDGSFTYGIDAPWGGGKTSFMNMMKGYINPDHNTIIDFNPWLYSDKKDLVSVFFDELSKNLKKFDKSLAKNIIDYSKILSVFNTNETKIIASLLDLVSQNVTLQEKKNQIENTLKHINRKIFVFIDDLDRLYADELLEMMKLIRNVSDFPNMYFIAAYDKQYLIQCLNTKMPTKGADFIEKVFTQEFHLPPSPQKTTSNALYKFISPLLADTEKAELSNYITEYQLDKYLPNISNLREIKRLANSVISDYSFNESYFKENRIICFVILEYFKIKYPLVFTFFESNWEILIDSQEINGRTVITLYSEESDDSKINFVTYIKENCKELCINDEDINSIKRMLKWLFGSNGFIDDLDLLCHYFNPTLY